jgi:hypothetical protein
MTTGANPFGLDVSWLDVPAFIATSQLLYALVAALWLLLALRLRRMIAIDDASTERTPREAPWAEVG